MGGGLLQIAAYGAQDVYLTGDPQITFFKVVYRRHTNFSMESIQQQFSGKANFGKNDVSTTISRNGDLASSMYLEVNLPACPSGATWIDGVGHRLIKSVRVNLGGDTIDEHTGRWLEIWDQLTHTSSMSAVYKEMTGDVGGTGGTSGNRIKMFIPLQFWFNRNPGLALPLIALQYHEVKIVFNFEKLEKLVDFTGTAPAAPAVGGTWSQQWLSNPEDNTNGPFTFSVTDGTTPGGSNAQDTMTDATTWFTELNTAGYSLDAKLYVDYIYLDTEERKRFSQMSHEYLIDQLQIQGKETITSFSHRTRLNFNHPVKELVWVLEPPENENNEGYNDGTGGGGDLGLQAFGQFSQATSTTTSHEWMKDAKLQINGHDRFSVRDSRYFRRVQPYQHHTGAPDKPVYCYSFALRPEEYQPSGTCNFSRIDNAYLEMNLRHYLGEIDYTVLKENAAFAITPYYSHMDVTNSTDFVHTNPGATNATFGSSKADAWATGTKIYLYLHAVSYNVLKIVSGRGGLAYSN